MDPATWRTIRIYALGGVVGAAVAVGVATCGLHLLGFRSAGVIAGSIAARIQSLIGSVARGSLFALMQSAGAVGLAARSKTAWAIGGCIAVVYFLRKLQLETRVPALNCRPAFQLFLQIYHNLKNSYTLVKDRCSIPNYSLVWQRLL